MGPAMKKDPSAPTSPPSKTPLPPPPLRRPPSPPPPAHLRSSLPPLPPPWGRGLLMPPAQGTPAAATPPSAIPSPEARISARGRHFSEHLVARARGARPDPDLAGVPPELLPPKKRIVRHHPYAAAGAIQEMATASCQGFTAVAVDRGEEDGLRAELLRLRISRPAAVLTKPLTPSDRSRDTGRLVLPDRLVRSSPLLGMLTAAERHLVSGRGLPVPAFDRLGRAYRMSLRRDPSARTYLLRGQWTLFVSRHDMRDGDAVELLAFRPSAWQARLDKHGEGGLGMALLHRPSNWWTSRERDAADGLLRLIAAAPSPSAPSCRLTTGGNGGLEASITHLAASNQVGVR